MSYQLIPIKVDRCKNPECGRRATVELQDQHPTATFKLGKWCDACGERERAKLEAIGPIGKIDPGKKFADSLFQYGINLSKVAAGNENE